MIYVAGSGGFLGRELIKQCNGKTTIGTITDRPNIKDYGENCSIDEFCLEKTFHSQDILFLAGNVYLKGVPNVSSLYPLFDYTLNASTKIALAFCLKGGGKVINFRSYIEMVQSFQNNNQEYYKSIKSAQADLIRKFTEINRTNLFEFTLYDNFGEGDTREKIIPKILKSVKSQEEVHIHAPNICLNLLHVRQQVKLILETMENEQPGHFCIANKKTITLREIAAIAKSINSNAKINLGSSLDKNFLPYGNLVCPEEFDVENELSQYFKSR